MQKYSDLGYNVSNQPSSVGKDYNDELVQLKIIKPLLHLRSNG